MAARGIDKLERLVEQVAFQMRRQRVKEQRLRQQFGRDYDQEVVDKNFLETLEIKFGKISDSVMREAERVSGTGPGARGTNGKEEKSEPVPVSAAGNEHERVERWRIERGQ